MLLMLCGGILNLQGAEIPPDYNKLIQEAISQEIEARKKDCPKTWSADKCESMSRLVVEASVWADVLEGDWEMEAAEVRNDFIYITVKRGGDIPLIGNIKVGEFKHVRKVWVDKGKLIIEYKNIDGWQHKAGWFGGGLGVGLIVALLLVLL